MKNLSDARSTWIDALRGLAAVAVTMFHLNEPIEMEHTWYRQGVKYGWLGVVVFFVVSGFCIHSAAVRSRSVGQYAWRRLTRIYPPYWASLMVVVAVGVGRKVAVGVNDRVVWPHDWVGGLATVTAMVWPATATPGMSWVYWTLAFELAFYTVTVAAVLCPRLFPWLTVGLAAAAVLPNKPTEIPGLFFLSHWPIYGLGVGLSLIAQGRRSTGTMVAIICGAIVAYLFAPPVWVAVGLAAGTIGLSYSRRFASLGNNILVRLGVISYSLYLLHVPIGCWLLLKWKTGSWATNPWLNLVYDFAVLCLCIAASAVFYRLIEAPSLWLGRVSFVRFRANPHHSNAV